MTINDRRVRDHHVKQALLKAMRTKQPVKGLVHGIGCCVTGSVFDIDRKAFERALKAYWSKLFLGWNPYKNEGRGCWEVWQEPNKRQELNDMEHWVADLPYLRWDFIQDLRRMDSWEHRAATGKQLWETMDDNYDEYDAELTRQEQDSIRYAVRHNKSVFGKLKDLAQDGYNPLWFFSDNRQGNGEV